MVRYVWSEDPSDLPDKVGWLSAAQRTHDQAPGEGGEEERWRRRGSVGWGQEQVELRGLVVVRV